MTMMAKWSCLERKLQLFAGQLQGQSGQMRKPYPPEFKATPPKLKPHPNCAF